MRRIEIWAPDTCGCKLTDAWEYLDSGPAICLGYGGSVIRKCEPHKDIPDEDLYDVLLGAPDGSTIGECRLKNYTYGFLIGKGGVDLGFHEAKRNKDGSDAGFGLKEGFNYKWHFTGTGRDRKLNIDVEDINTKESKLTPAHKKTIKDACDGRFGKDRVIV